MIEEVVAKLSGDVRRIDETNITFQGILIPEAKSDYERLAYLCYKFREAVKYATAKLHKGVKISYRDLMFILPNAWYCIDVIRVAKPLSKANRRPKIKRLFLKSTGNKHKEGNQNIKIDLDNNTVRVRDPFSRTWLKFKLKIDNRIRIYQYTFDHYTATISFREGKIRIYITIPFKPEKYLEGKYIASFDLNSDRINMVMVDNQGIIRDVRNIHFHCVTSPGFPRNRARDIRLKALAKLLDYAKHNNCYIVVFENVKMNNRSKTKSKKANRKITKFACNQMLSYGINMALRRGFRVYLVSPKNISKIAREMHGKLGLDVHTASAFLLALRFLKYRLSKR